MRALNVSVLVAALAFAACSSDPPPKKTTSLAEARDPEVVEVVRAPATVPAPSSAPAEVVSDAGPSPRVDLQRRIFNRVLAKATGPVDVEALRAEIEAATGARVEKIRKGALGLVSIEFASTDPPRDAAAQKKLVETVKAMGRFKYVEAEKLMKAK